MEEKQYTKEELLELSKIIYKTTLGYSLDKIVVNEDGSLKHIHSDEFLDNHPERRENQEFTPEEEIECANFLQKLVKEDYEEFGPLPLKKEKVGNSI